MLNYWLFESKTLFFVAISKILFEILFYFFMINN